MSNNKKSFDEFFHTKMLSKSQRNILEVAKLIAEKYQTPEKINQLEYVGAQITDFTGGKFPKAEEHKSDILRSALFYTAYKNDSVPFELSDADRIKALKEAIKNNNSTDEKQSTLENLLSIAEINEVNRQKLQNGKTSEMVQAIIEKEQLNYEAIEEISNKSGLEKKEVKETLNNMHRKYKYLKNFQSLAQDAGGYDFTKLNKMMEKENNKSDMLIQQQRESR